MKPRFFLIIIAFVTIFLSCGKDDNGPTGTENTAPILSSIGNQTVAAGQTKNVALSATDADGNTLTFSIPTNPGFLSITGLSQIGDTATATLVISPDETITGTFDATVQVSDVEGGIDSESFNIEVKQAVEGKWLKYWSGAQPARLNLNVKYYCVRFTKPTNWESISIDSIKIIAASSGQIKPCFWDNYNYTDNQYWPVDPPLKGQTKSVAYGGNKWSISSNNWTTDQTEFFIGFEQIGSIITLCGDGQCQPENRSYRRYESSNWEQEWGMFANYCIDVYVIKVSK